MYMTVKQAAENGAFQIDEYESYARKVEFQALSVRGAVGRFRQRPGSRRMDVISPQKICLIVLTGRKRNWIPNAL